MIRSAFLRAVISAAIAMPYLRNFPGWPSWAQVPFQPIQPMGRSVALPCFMRCGILVVLFALISSGQAIGGTDGFEDLGADGSTVVPRVIDDVSVTVSTGGSQSLLAATYYATTPNFFGGAGGVSNAPLVPNNVTLSRFITPGTYFIDARPIVFEFSEPVASFGLTTIDLLEDSGATGKYIVLRAFDVNDGVLDEHARFGGQGPAGLDLDWVVSSNAGIMRVELDGNVGSAGGNFGIDDLTLLLPEPTSLALLGLGGIAFLRRSR